MTVTESFHLALAHQAHEDISAAAARGDRALATKGRRWYRNWLADHHYHEVWERECGAKICPISGQDGHGYRFVRLECTAGKSWGGA